MTVLKPRRGTGGGGLVTFESGSKASETEVEGIRFLTNDLIFEEDRDGEGVEIETSTGKWFRELCRE